VGIFPRPRQKCNANSPVHGTGVFRLVTLSATKDLTRDREAHFLPEALLPGPVSTRLLSSWAQRRTSLATTNHRKSIERPGQSAAPSSNQSGGASSGCPRVTGNNAAGAKRTQPVRRQSRMSGGVVPAADTSQSRRPDYAHFLSASRSTLQDTEPM